MHPKEDVINGYVEDALAPAERLEVERHLESCENCRQLAADLAEIRRVASSLEMRQPPAQAWDRIEAAIKGSNSRSLLWLAAAAALVIATVVGVRFATRTPAPTPRSAQSTPAEPASASGSMSAEAVEAELRAAEAHYEKAIKGLEQIATAEKSALDPNTAATLQKNLAVIDQAISESRAAVRSQPASEPAVTSLMDNFKTKLALLQDTVALINEMRKGNEQGTAKIVSGLKQKGN
jgi:anti-sigma factor RsiW